MNNPADYTITIQRLLEGEHVYRASVKELPHLFEYGDTPMEVYDLAIVSIQSLQYAAAEEGRDFPPPQIDL